ncbi:MAG: dihydroneopterin aldolase [Pseudomonadota bacterium]
MDGDIAASAATTATALRLAPHSVFVRALRLDAEIGVYAHEHGRRQPLVIDLDLKVAAITDKDAFEDAVCYAWAADQARAVLSEGRLNLVETAALRIAERCLEDRRVERVRVRVEKPEALGDAAGVGVELELDRAAAT